jgi:hypothetical protein
MSIQNESKISVSSPHRAEFELKCSKYLFKKCEIWNIVNRARKYLYSGMLKTVRITVFSVKETLLLLNVKVKLKVTLE